MSILRWILYKQPSLTTFRSVGTKEPKRLSQRRRNQRNFEEHRITTTSTPKHHSSKLLQPSGNNADTAFLEEHTLTPTRGAEPASRDTTTLQMIIQGA